MLLAITLSSLAIAAGMRDSCSESGIVTTAEKMCRYGARASASMVSMPCSTMWITWPVWPLSSKQVCRSSASSARTLSPSLSIFEMKGVHVAIRRSSEVIVSSGAIE